MVSEVSDDNFRKEVLEYSKNSKVLVDFYTKWCMPCKLMDPIFKTLESEYPGIKFVKVNIDINPKIALKYDIDSVPSIQVFENESIFKGFNGYKNSTDIRKWLDKNIKKI
jgi:thioredoxin 1